MTESFTAGTDGVIAGRVASRASFVFGAALSFLGVLAIMVPLFTGITFSVFVGLLLVLGGIFELVFAFKAPSFGRGVLVFLFGGLSIVAGAVLVVMPDLGLGAMTWLLAAFFVAAGIVDIVMAFKLRPEDGWGWTLFSGIVTVALGAFIVWQWPVSGIWAVGLFVGVRLLMHGFALMALGITGGDVMAAAQEERLEIVENRVMAGVEALQQVQLALATHTAALLAIQAQVLDKVDTDEVDPAIRELNTQLGVARDTLAKVVDEGFDAWAQAQEEAEQVLGSLQDSVTAEAERLVRGFGKAD